MGVWLTSCARNIELIGEDNNESDHTPASTSRPTNPRQPRIDDTLHKNAKDAYKKLIKTAYLIAVGGIPLVHFETVVICQKANGVKLIHGCTSGKQAREFVHEIADAIREKLALIMCTVHSFGILTDGSQARKTSQEFELVLIRVVRGGIPLYYCVSLADMDAWGDANADNLKLAIDDVFEKLSIPTDDCYIKKMVCATSDGASVNTGKYNGLLVQLQRSQRPWLIYMHCVSHRLELALKDSLLKEMYFSRAKDLMVTIFYLFMQSGKMKRKFHSMAKLQGVTVYNFPKVHGARFINHQRRGLQVLLHNWGVLIQLLEHCIASPEGSYRANKPKLKGILKKLKSFRFLCHCSFYLHLLDNISHFSLALERGDVNIFEIPMLLETTTSANSELLVSATDYVTCLKETGIHVTLKENGEVDKLTWSLPKIGHKRKHSDNREFVDVVVNRSSLIDVHDAALCAEQQSSLASKIVDDVNKCMNQRFQSERETELFQSMIWLDPANWSDDIVRELAMMNTVAEHFSVTLELAGYEHKNLKKEWLKLKSIQKLFYKGVNAKKLWQQFLTYRRDDAHNICLLVEIILCIGVSNSMVEKAFSQLTAMLSDRRLSMKPETMDDLLVIKVNHATWSPKERDEIIEAALNKHMQKRRKLKIDQTPFNMLGVHDARMLDDVLDLNDVGADGETPTHSQATLTEGAHGNTDDSSSSSEDDGLLDIEEVEEAIEHIVLDAQGSESD